jgi:hypothetical protein
MALLHPIEKFSLGKYEGPYKEWDEFSDLLADGVATGRRVPGCVIEGQYAYGDGYLLINSYDCAFEEGQTFLLLDSQFRIKARRDIWTMYDTWLLMKHYPVGEDQLELDFAPNEIFCLKIRSSRWPSFWRFKFWRRAGRYRDPRRWELLRRRLGIRW